MKIGFIGLGLMGRGMASRLQAAGHELVVYDLSSEAVRHLAEGTAWAGSPRAVAESVDLVFTSLPTPPIVEAVAFGSDGLAQGFRPGAAWFDMSTNAVDVVRRLQERLSGQGVDFLDAPVSGGPAGAASGRMAIWVGGDEAAFTRHKGALDAMSDEARYIGSIGAGTIAKLTHNMASAVMSGMLAEVASLGVKAGLDPLALWEAIRGGAMGRQRSFEKLGERFLHGQFEPASFQLQLLHKDVSLALQLGREVGVPMRLCNLVASDIVEAMNRGWSHRDAHSAMALQWERAGLPPVAVPKDDIKAVQARG